MKYLIVLISFNCMAMYYPQEYVENPIERPGAMNFLEKKQCEEHYGKVCVLKPKDYDLNYHEYVNGEFKINAAKKAAHDAAIAQEKAQKEQEKASAKAMKNKIESGASLNQSELNQLLKYLLKRGGI